MHYQDDEAWPSLPDGGGPSLEFTGTSDPRDFASRDRPDYWRPSVKMGGTPGAENSRRRDPTIWAAARRSVLAAESGLWRVHRGRTAPSPVEGDWIESDFDDGPWEELPGPFGFGESHGFIPSTVLDDMLLSYSGVFLRTTFEVSEERLAELRDGESTPRLRVRFDDGYAAYLNGVEVSRGNLGVPGQPIAFDAVALSDDSGSEDALPDRLLDALVTGRNVLAIHAANARRDSDDFFIGAQFFIEEPAEVVEAPDEPIRLRGLLNEMRPSDKAGTGSFIEFFNPTEEEISLGGFVLLSDNGDRAVVPNLQIDRGAIAHWSLERDGAFFVSETVRHYAIISPEGVLVDVFEAPDFVFGNSAGRFPDGDGDVYAMVTPTPGASNVYEYRSPLIFSEIYYHPPYVEPFGEGDDACVARCSDRQQWIELHNRSDEEVELGGWAISRGVRFRFEVGTRLASGERIVVAADVDEFRAAHPEVPPGLVVGPWTGRLSHSTDRLRLRNPLGNAGDEFRYGDGGPTNDVEPVDGLDDETFLGSDWPRGASGTGYSIERRHSELEARLGASWDRSASMGGTPSSPNSAASLRPAPVVGEVRHSPHVPTSSDSVRIRVRVSSVDPIESVKLRWAVDGRGDNAPLEMRDDGKGSDARAGNGVWTAELPPHASGTLIRFSVETLDSSGGQSRIPVAPTRPPYASFEGPYFLVRFEDSPPPTNGSSVARILMTGRDVSELRSRPPGSDVLLPSTLILSNPRSGKSNVRHIAGLRLRGESSRREPNLSFRVNLPPERSLTGRRRFNFNGSNGGIFNSQNVKEYLAMDLFRRVGEPYALEDPIVLQ
ncbi:MAG: lamin tail domain-containing protein, partial [Planctomycetota bacterium]